MAENNVNTQEVATEDEISAIEQDETIAEDTAVEEEIANEETAEAPKKRKLEIKFKNPKTQEKWEKVLAWLDAHETMFQAIKFTLISLVAFLSEFAIMYILQYSLLKTCGQEDFKWWIFEFDGGKAGSFGLAGFIAMLGSKLVAEIISFTQNWKKNFKANSNKAFAVTVYVITVVALIIFSTWLAGVVSNAVGEKVADLGTTVGKMIGSVISFVVIFLMDKFVIMRRKPEKQEECGCDGNCECCSCHADEDVMEISAEDVLDSIPEDANETVIEEVVETIEDAIDSAAVASDAEVPVEE